ncbi:MAG: AIR carboxylase family protein [bacterium]|nr:AIR carboxylase family protein [bacterium]
MARTKKMIGQQKELAVIIMGSPADGEYAEKIGAVLGEFGVKVVLRVASAHKTPDHLLKIVEDYDGGDKKVVYIAVAGRSNALGGFIDCQTQNPVISAPPYGEKYAGFDIFSSIRMPSGVATTVASEAEMAALAAVKIFALENPKLRDKFADYQKSFRERIVQADKKVNLNSGFCPKLFVTRKGSTQKSSGSPRYK